MIIPGISKKIILFYGEKVVNKTPTKDLYNIYSYNKYAIKIKIKLSKIKYCGSSASKIHNKNKIISESSLNNLKILEIKV